MPSVFKVPELKLSPRKADLPDFVWNSSERLSQLAKSERLVFDIRSLDPGRFSFPYHFHRHAEEMFYIISGSCTLRTRDGFQQLEAGALVHFEAGENGAHQLYNHTQTPCVYLDIRTFDGVDVTEYPDTGKVAILPELDVFKKEQRTSYYDGEENVRQHWPKDIVG